MRIVCPSCGTAYAVPDRAIGAEGRKVRCARCATSWRVRPPQPDDMPDEMPDEARATVAAPAAAEPDTLDPGR
ncbi:zinc-ribbon domain-containing protein, partial [Mycobacterium tuberculosis]|nr:zinc-ribbon domain-containing protein [Mycobacterium tuberculosis]